MGQAFKCFVEGSGCTETEILGVLEEIENYQVNAESQVAGPDSLGPRLQAYRIFKSAIDDDSLSDDAVATLLAGMDKIGSQVSRESVARIRRVISECTLLFTSCESPTNVGVLCKLFDLLKGNVSRRHSALHLILATDARYHPHASVHFAKGNVYAIVLSSNLIGDLLSISAAFTTLAIQGQPNETRSFITPFVQGTIREAYDKSDFAIQLPYQLAAAALGEKFRFALAITNIEEITPWISSVYLCMLAFLIGHELGHIVLEHTAAPPDPTNAFIDYVLDPTSSLYSLRDMPHQLQAHYRLHYSPQHCREFEADLFGAGVAGNLAVDLFSNRNVGFISASIVLGVIAFMDRASFFSRTLVDPLAVVTEKHYNGSPLAVDVMLPCATHPWGVSRYALSGPNLLLQSGLTFTNEEWDDLKSAVQNANYPLSRAAHGACIAMAAVIHSRFEVSCILIPGGLHVTVWERWPDGRCTVVNESIEAPTSFLSSEKLLSVLLGEH